MNLQKKWMRLNSMTIPPNIDQIGLMMLIQDIPSLEKDVKSNPSIAKISQRKNYFLVACRCINSHNDIYDVNVKSPFRGLIGVDDSRFERTSSFSKFMRMHVVLHDASGFFKRYSNEGPGFIYVMVKHSPGLLNTYCIRQITGVFYCCFLEFVDRNTSESFDV